MEAIPSDLIMSYIYSIQLMSKKDISSIDSFSSEEAATFVLLAVGVITAVFILFDKCKYPC